VPRTIGVNEDKTGYGGRTVLGEVSGKEWRPGLRMNRRPGASDAGADGARLRRAHDRHSSARLRRGRPSAGTSSMVGSTTVGTRGKQGRAPD
jgi:hypothetical protein